MDEQTYREGLDEATKAFLAKKTGVMIAIPNLGSQINTALTMWLIGMAYRSLDGECPYFFKLHMPNDLVPVEHARNECVREFLRDPFYKKLFFIDADMIPPANAMMLLDYDAPMVSGMTYIWGGGAPDKHGFYIPPKMKINAFDYQPLSDDFISKMPPNDNKAFTCDAAGAACFVISRELLEEMPEPWFRTKRDPYGAGLRGEDLDFCLRANGLGKRVIYVPSVQFGHLKLMDLSEVTKYGLCSMRNLIRNIKAAGTDLAKIASLLPDITFANEAPDPEIVPHDFKLVEGGKR